MAYLEEIAVLLRGDLDGEDPLREIRMFGGLCFTLNGHMVGGVLGSGMILRLPPESADAALALPGVSPFPPEGRPMRGMVVLEELLWSDEAARREWVERAREFVRGLPPKPEKLPKRR